MFDLSKLSYSFVNACYNHIIVLEMLGEAYDENLSENPFFQVLSSEFSELFRKAVLEDWIVCVPCVGSVPKYLISEEYILSHILVPSDELPNSHFRTLNGKYVRIFNRVLTVEESDIARPFTSHILFEETHYTDDSLKFKVICIDTPLIHQSEVISSNSSGIVVVQTLRDCIDLLWSETAGKGVLETLDECINSFSATHDKLECEPLNVIRDLVGKLYSKCLQKALKDDRLRTKSDSSKHMLDNVKLSVETYVLHGIYQNIFKCITTCTAFEDSLLNKIIRNLCDLQLRDLDIKYDLFESVPWAKQELSRIDRYSTVLGKVGCLKRMACVIMKQNSNNSSTITISTDDFLPLIVFLIIKSGIPNWIAHLTFMKEFHFSSPSSSQVDEHSFLLTSLEAAIEHIKSGSLLGHQFPECQYSHESAEEDSDQMKLDNNYLAIPNFFSKIKEGNLESVKQLLDKNLQNVCDRTSKTRTNVNKLCHPLCSCDKCEKILSENLNDTTPTINSCDDRGFTALHISCMSGQPAIVDLLLNSGANVDSTDYRGCTPLHYASMKGHQNCLLLLLHANSVMNSADNDGNTPLHYASNNGHDGCVKALLYFAEYSGKKLNVNSVNNLGDSPLHFAARWGYEVIVEILIEYGANPLIQNKRHITPFGYAHSIRISKLLHETRNGKMLTVLKGDVSNSTNHSSQLDLNAHTSRVESESVRPTNTHQIKQVDKLLRSIEVGDIRLACYYLGLNVPSGKQDIFECSGQSLCHPLCDCEKCSSESSIDLKSSESSNSEFLSVNVSNAEGVTPLHVAAIYGRSELVRLLLDSGALPNVKTRLQGSTPLHFACQNERIQITSMLLDSALCNIDIQDIYGDTPLHLACRSGNIRLVELLMKYAPSLNFKNCHGQTALEEAQQKTALSLVQLLRGGKAMKLSLSDSEES